MVALTATDKECLEEMRKATKALNEALMLARRMGLTARIRCEWDMREEETRSVSFSLVREIALV